MSDPRTCSSAGGAISLWVKVIDCPSRGGIVSSVNAPFHTGSAIICENQHIRYETSYYWQGMLWRGGSYVN